jgi:DNA-directed RNA polymerase specialized sigma24 family protein
MEKAYKFPASELGPKSADMFVDELSTKEALVRMVRRMTANVALREDLLQEALIHLWLTESRRPAQTRSWYLQSCKYHLLHYLASGRSVDSGKRRAGQMLPSYEAEPLEGFPEEMDSGNSVLTWVSARDIIALLSPQLLPLEIAVLHCFADGLGPREIGRKLKMSHTMVIKHRRKIASLFNRLDLPATRARIQSSRQSQAGLGDAQLRVPAVRSQHQVNGNQVNGSHGSSRANGHGNSNGHSKANGHGILNGHNQANGHPGSNGNGDGNGNSHNHAGSNGHTFSTHPRSANGQSTVRSLKRHSLNSRLGA